MLPDGAGKEGADELYDLNKIIFFAKREKKRIKRLKKKEEDQCEFMYQGTEEDPEGAFISDHPMGLWRRGYRYARRGKKDNRHRVAREIIGFILDKESTMTLRKAYYNRPLPCKNSDVPSEDDQYLLRCLFTFGPTLR